MEEKGGYLLDIILQVADPELLGITPGNKLLAGLLTLIGTLIWYIWRNTISDAKERHLEQKQLAEMRHKDTMLVMEKLTIRQRELEDKQRDQGFQLYTLSGLVNLIQGKGFDYDNPHPGKKKE